MRKGRPSPEVFGWAPAAIVVPLAVICADTSLCFGAGKECPLSVANASDHASPYSQACAVFGCPRPVTARGRCATHAQRLGQTRGLDCDRHRGRALYQTARWRALRRWLLNRSPLCTCTECEQLKRVRVATVVHHRQPHGGDEEKFFNVELLQPLAKACHDRITATQTHAKTEGGKGPVSPAEAASADHPVVFLARPPVTSGGVDRG
jgi:5-methylcytosine-specific restriction protein A